MNTHDIDLIRRKKQMGYGMTNSEIKALHDADRIPRRPIAVTSIAKPQVVNQLGDRIHTLNPRSVQDNAGAGTSTTVQNYPFLPTIAGTSATIAYGTLNGSAPTNIGSSFTFPAFGTRYFVLSVTASSGVVSSSFLSVDSSPPAGVGTSLGFPPNTFKVLLYVSVNQRLFRTIGPGSLQAVPLEVFRVQKVITTPDMLPYDSYYTWSVSGV